MKVPSIEGKEKRTVRLKFVIHPKKNETTIQQTTTVKQMTTTYQCPYCDQILTLDDEIDDSTTISCPQCHKDGLIIPTANNKTLKKTNKQKTLAPTSWLSQPDLRAKTTGLFIIIIGFIILFYPSSTNIKISITLFFIGSLLFTLIPEKRIIASTPADSRVSFLKRNKLIISEKITLLIIIATVFLFLITNPADIEIFLVLLYLCLLIIKELIDEFTPLYMKRRLNIFVMIFFVIFIIIIAERIITILNI